VKDHPCMSDADLQRHAMKVVYSPDYAVPFWDHPFNTSKYALVLEQLKAEGLISEADVIEAPMADDEDILRVHTLEYWEKLRSLFFSEDEIARAEVPINKRVMDFFWRAAGGTIRASKQALLDGVCVHLGGGFHHAFPDYASGFCLINDIAVSLRTLLDNGSIETAAVIDCDLHQGDGTAWIFRDDPRVFTFSIHQRRAFPHAKQHSTLDVELEDGRGDDEYDRQLGAALDTVFSGQRRFDLIHYQAGADPFVGDALGGLGLSMEGLLERDRMVFRAARTTGCPVVVSLGGGYAPDVMDVVRIHLNTVRAAAEIKSDPV
jgi:acetoin utilization deacetylase AcuC-like enzyme